jgi:hypothetical protein
MLSLDTLTLDELSALTLEELSSLVITSRGVAHEVSAGQSVTPNVFQGHVSEAAAQQNLVIGVATGLVAEGEITQELILSVGSGGLLSGLEAGHTVLPSLRLVLNTTINVEQAFNTPPYSIEISEGAIEQDVVPSVNLNLNSASAVGQSVRIGVRQTLVTDLGASQEDKPGKIVDHALLVSQLSEVITTALYSLSHDLEIEQTVTSLRRDLLLTSLLMGSNVQYLATALQAVTTGLAVSQNVFVMTYDPSTGVQPCTVANKRVRAIYLTHDTYGTLNLKAPEYGDKYGVGIQLHQTQTVMFDTAILYNWNWLRNKRYEFNVKFPAVCVNQTTQRTVADRTQFEIVRQFLTNTAALKITLVVEYSDLTTDEVDGFVETREIVFTENRICTWSFSFVADATYNE